MNKTLTNILLAAIILIGGFLIFNFYTNKNKPEDEQVVAPKNYKEIEYMIEGKSLGLGGELDYFGNELFTDLNDDGRDDVVFLVTHQPGGSGTFYYAVSALDTGNGYVGSDGYLLGDRIAPQNIQLSPNPKHMNVIVVNYADRLAGEPMTTQPSVGKSAYLKLDVDQMQWGIVVPDFEGESR